VNSGASMNSFHGFTRELEGLVWAPAGYLDPRVLDLLCELGQEPRTICDVVNSWSAANLEERQLSCHETSTHYKWFVAYHSSLHYKIWLHQYKPLGERRLGHAEVPHNHRYSLASLVVRGGFTHHYYKQTAEGLQELQHERTSYMQGDTYRVDWQEVHKLSNVLNHTVTLVVESPIARNFSEAFYTQSGEPSTFYDFIGMLSSLSAEISSA
jgi:hypothetical protein